MLFSKPNPSFREQLAERLTIEQLEEIIEKKRRQAAERGKGKGDKGQKG